MQIISNDAIFGLFWFLIKSMRTWGSVRHIPYLRNENVFVTIFAKIVCKFVNCNYWFSREVAVKK